MSRHGLRETIEHALLLVFLTVVSNSSKAADTPFPLVEAKECRAREGLPNFLAKAKTPGANVKVAYFGGSITEQAGWRPKSLAYLQKTYPKAKFSEVNAAIGGTGSVLGVYRLEQDVLDAKPDLVFVEFATNDSQDPPLQIQKCFEGIVRKIWKALPKCDICFVYTLVETQAPPMLEGKFPQAPSAMEAVAEHYGIPSIHMATEVARLAKDGKLVWAAPLPDSSLKKARLGGKIIFASDGVHPYPETGHELYLDALVRSFKPIAEASKAVGPHSLKAPLIAGNYENAKLIPIQRATLSKDIEALDPKSSDLAKNFNRNLKSLYRATHAGDSITFQFRGTSAGIFDVIGPDSGQVLVTVDDQPPRVIPRFDPWCTSHRLAVIPIATDLPEGVHTVKVEIHPDKPDKMKILGHKAKNLGDLSRFEGTNLYPGAILLIGDLIR